jgi:hypothetical protein
MSHASRFQRLLSRFVAAAAAFAVATGTALAEDAAAQLERGLMHYHGRGVPADELKAIEWLERSAAQGNADAMYQIGNILAFGSEAYRASRDPDVDAARWYFQAARLGHAEAQYALGLFFLSGKGVVHSREQGLDWINAAAAQGHKEAGGFVVTMEPGSR